MFAAKIKGNGLLEMKTHPHTFVQFACPVNETADDDLFFKHLIRNIDRQNIPIAKVFYDIAENVHQQRHGTRKPFHPAELQNDISVYLNLVELERRT
jgi:hypothetical protein